MFTEPLRHSLLVPALADRVLKEFYRIFQLVPGGFRGCCSAVLLFCANVLRLAHRAATPSPLAEPARKAADDLLNSLAS
jgi:hypothetical protein